MGSSFCNIHILAFLNAWNGSSSPLDLALSQYFKAHRSLGAKDRRIMGETVYTLIRWKSLFDCLDPTGSFAIRLHLLSKRSLFEYCQDPSIPEFARLGLSPFLFDKWVSLFGVQETRRLASMIATTAPTSLRVNLIKTTRDHLLSILQEKMPAFPGKIPTAITLLKREALFALPAFKQGLFEVQDEGSQKIADLIEAQSGQRVLDYCSGSGGKALAIAPKMQGKGELYLHDIRMKSLQEAILRLRRAGVQNAQVLPPEHPTLPKLLHKMDWVLVDAPCSGTGTLRRNPEMKWKIDTQLIDRLTSTQRTIMRAALDYVKPGGKIVYATCSILPEENEAQVSFFLSRFKTLQLIQEPLSFLPEQNGPDGFFGAVFKIAS